jgi:hypothetical protein
MNMKGSLYTLESAIAILLMVTVLTLVVTQPQSMRELDIVNYKLRVFNALKATDDIGDLKVYVLNNDVNTIKAEVEQSGTPYLDYWVVIYNRTDALTVEPDIEAQNVVTVSYFLAGYVGDYDPREVRVFMWGFD